MNAFQKALLGLTALTLVGCASTPSSEEGSVSDAPASSSQEKSYPPSVRNSAWGLEFASACYDTVKRVIPYYENEGFEYVITTDAYGDPMFEAFLYYEDDDALSKAFNGYCTACASDGYAVEVSTQKYVDYDTLTYITYDCGFADALVAQYEAVEIQFVESQKNGKPCLGLFCFNYRYIPKNEYPQLAVVDLLGEEGAEKVPSAAVEGATYKFGTYLEDDGTKVLEIQVYGADYSLEEDYFNALLAQNRWIIMDSVEGSDTQYKEYPGYDYGTYYYAFSYDITLIFEYSLDYNCFILDIFPYGV